MSFQIGDLFRVSLGGDEGGLCGGRGRDAGWMGDVGEHVGGEDLEATAATLLGAVHRGVNAFEQ